MSLFNLFSHSSNTMPRHVRPTCSQQTADPNSGYGILCGNERTAYVQIVDALSRFETELIMDDYQFYGYDIEKIWYAVKKDNPGIFWCDRYTYTYSPSDNIVRSMQFEYSFSVSRIKRMQSDIENAKGKFLKGISPRMDDYHKAKIIHDNIILNTAYDSYADNNQNIYSVLMGKRSVCAGYSKAFQFLLQEVGVFCTVVNGTSDRGGAHCWNLVKMDGDYYHIDVTFDEDDSNRTTINYNHFGITTEERLRNCSIIEEYNQYTWCTAITDNYYYRENKYYYCPEAFVDAFSDLLRRRGSYITGKLPTGTDLKYVEAQCIQSAPCHFDHISYSIDDLHSILSISVFY